MAQAPQYDAVVIGSGPNGLAAAITLAQAGKSVIVLEANASLGGGVRSAELTLPGYTHDVCSSVYPLAIGSPFFRTLPLQDYGLQWVEPPLALAHPLDDGSAVLLHRSVDKTMEGLNHDAESYRAVFGWLADCWDGLDADILAPPHSPRHAVQFLRFGYSAIQPARRFATARFSGLRAQALFAGIAAHSMLSLDHWGSAAFGLVLGAAGHAFGWPLVRGGAQGLADALAAYFTSLGGKIILGHSVQNLEELPNSRAVLCDLTPRQLVTIAGAQLTPSYRRKVSQFRYGMAAYKIDWALSAPVPWKAPECAVAATVHLGGTIDEIAASEEAAWNGQYTPRPFVLVVQPSLFDRLRAPDGKHTLWGYCHVPNGAATDMTEAIERQIERFAPGFRDCILARAVAPPAELERRNANLVGGDINGGAPDIRQLFLRPNRKLYSTSKKGLYLCSASTPPGGGVHGMCGHFAARRALREIF
ncbi:MAG TPA: NAD(P)/FAD-dependent oxidoreductase [Candidatus Binatia bacterium]